MGRIIRVFVSSTFADFAEERAILQERVWPALDEFARSLGARFEAVDLRWGISPEAQRQHSTMSICMEELTRCQRLSPQPNFIILLGQRFGWEPPPAEVGDRTWQALMAIPDAPETSVVAGCYRKDTNALPESVWVLQPPDVWPGGIAESQLVEAIRCLAINANLPPEEREFFFRSATAHEIHAGALAVPNSGEHVCAYVRTIAGVTALPDRDQFLDVSPDGAFVQGAADRMNELVASVRAPGTAFSVRDYRPEWHDKAARATYLDEFARDVLDDHKRLISRQLGGLGNRELDDVDSQQWAFAAERSRVLVGREVALGALEEYVLAASHDAAPLVVAGSGGSGKSALLGAGSLSARASNPKAVVLVRFLGAVPGSESLRRLVTDLAAVVPTSYGADPIEVGPLIPDLADALEEILSFGESARPLILFLDALDQLTPIDWAHEFGWIPQSLPPNSKLIVSVREGPIGQALTERLPRAQRVIVGPLAAADGRIALTELVSRRTRTLTSEQLDAAVDSFGPEGLPLWLVLASESLAHLHSYDAAPRLPGTVDGLVNQLVADLSTEARHGNTLVRRALALIGASQHGLSEDELARALGSDEDVRQHFLRRSRQMWEGHTLPPIVWARLRHDLDAYLSEQYTDGTLVLRFFHREFDDLVAERLLSPVDDADLKTHTALAHVFSPPFASDNWYHIVSDRPMDTSVWRSVTQQAWHLARAALQSREDPTGPTTEGSELDFIVDPFLDVPLRIWSAEELRIAYAAAGLVRHRHGEAESIQRVMGWVMPIHPGESRRVSAALLYSVSQGHHDLATALVHWKAAPLSAASQLGLGWVACEAGDREAAAGFWRQAGDLGDTGAMLLLAVLAGQSGDQSTALLWIRKAAERGDGTAAEVVYKGSRDGLVDADSAQWHRRALAGGTPDFAFAEACRAREDGDVTTAVDLFMRAADAGRWGAYFALGLMAQDAGDLPQAVRWYGLGANQGDVYAMVNLSGVMARLGESIEAGVWLHRAASAGDSDAMMGFASNLEDAGDWDGAELWYRRAAAAGHIMSMIHLGQYLRRTGGAIPSGTAWLQRAATLGHPHAMLLVAEAARSTGDQASAEEWLRRAAESATGEEWSHVRELMPSAIEAGGAPRSILDAAERGDVRALEDLGIVADMAGDESGAAAWWQSAAAQGHAPSMYNLGCLEQRHGDVEAAAAWWEAAANLGHAEASYNLGQFANEVGDHASAVRWWERAATQGHANAMFNLGGACLKAGDASAAEAWLTRAADAGSGHAMYLLGQLAAESDSGSAGRVWWERAAAVGFAPAMIALAVLARRDGDVESALNWADASTDRADVDAMRGLASFAIELSDFNRARDLLHLLATGGDTASMIMLAELAAGDGDSAAAAQWYETAASAGDTVAMTMLAFRAREVGDAPTSARLFGQAAALGNEYAMYMLGLIASELGDLTGARQWYEQAAAVGNAQAMYALGEMACDDGDSAAANDWWHRADASAAEGLEPLEANNIAWNLLRLGDTENGMEWLERSARAGVPHALATHSWLLLTSGEHQRACQFFDEVFPTCQQFTATPSPDDESNASVAAELASQVANAMSNDALNRLAEGGSTDRALAVWSLTALTGHSESLLYPAVVAYRSGDVGSASAIVARLPIQDRHTLAAEMRDAISQTTSPWFASWCDDALLLLERI